MSNNSLATECVQAIRSRIQTDPATHLECLEFIRAAIAKNDHEFAQQIAAILKDVCQMATPIAPPSGLTLPIANASNSKNYWPRRQ